MGYAVPLGKFHYKKAEPDIMGLAESGLPFHLTLEREIARGFSVNFMLKNTIYFANEETVLNLLKSPLIADNYYIKEEKIKNNNYFLTVLAFGLRKKYIYKKFLIEPGLFIGISYFTPDFEYELELKEKGSNYYKNYSISFSSIERFPLNISPQIRSSTKFHDTEKLVIDFLIEVMYIRHKMNVLQETNSIDLLNNQTYSETEFSDIIQSIDFLIGLIFRF